MRDWRLGRWTELRKPKEPDRGATRKALLSKLLVRKKAKGSGPDQLTPNKCNRTHSCSIELLILSKRQLKIQLGAPPTIKYKIKVETK